MSSKKEVLETFFYRVWTEEDRGAIRELFVPNQETDKAWGLKKDEGLTPEAFEGFHDCILNLVEEVTITIDKSIEDGDWLFIECTLNAKSKVSISKEEQITMKGCVVVRIKNNKLIVGRNHFDFLNFFEDLGLLPSDTFESCLLGNKVS